jgi:hypothetical protein
MVFALLLAVKSAAPTEPESGLHVVWEWIEANAAFTYPGIALLVIGLIAAAMISSARADTMTAERRGQIKMQIMGVMRRRVSGVSAEAVAQDLQIDVLLASQLLSDLAAEGLIAEALGGADGAAARYRLRASGS